MSVLPRWPNPGAEPKLRRLTEKPKIRKITLMGDAGDTPPLYYLSS
jgi:hypothetical protein